MKKKNVNALLVEIMIAVLSFSLATIVILQTFVAAYTQSIRADEITEALLSAQNLADIVSVTENEDLDSMLATERDAEGNYIFPDVRNISITLTMTEEETPAGTFRRGVVQGTREDQVVFTLPCSHYSQKVIK